jgi:hypothetical protein
VLALLVAAAGFADEGMWMPQQVPQLGDQLRKAGLQLDPKQFADLTGDPMGAIISLGGCSASFVSPQGLVVTNHHCAYGSLQFNSTPERDLITNGFLAKTLAEELPAAAGARVFVTTGIEDVTPKVTGNIGPRVADVDRARTVERRIKEIVADCERAGGVRCRVSSFFEGSQYLKLTQMEIRDVRLVYAPARGVGEYGGETDNWMWPRHTGDFSFYRAYVGKDGHPADYSPENVPYQPKHFLKISPADLDPGDLVIVAGYPGRTYRYRTSNEIRSMAEFSYPTAIRYYRDVIAILEKNGEGKRDVQIRNASRIKGLANSYKNNQGMVEGIRHSTLVEMREKGERELATWIAADPARQKRFGDVIGDLVKIEVTKQTTRESDTVFSWLFRASSMLSEANTIWRAALERPKADLDRAEGFQERDWRRIREGMRRAQRGFEPASDRAALRYFLVEATKLPAGQRIEAVDKALAATGAGDVSTQIDRFLDGLYAGTKIASLEERMKMFDETTAQLSARNDSMLAFAAGLTKFALASEERRDALAGATLRVRPRYFEALRAMKDGLLYPDANGTLRITFGTVLGYAPRDAVVYAPQTLLAGVVAKDTGEEPFDSPKALLEAAKTKTAGYVDPELGDVPVNYVSTVDTTGGNSGSPTLNAKGELCGLLFDGNYEGMAGDYFVDDATSRSIHVDTQYMLWVMDAVDGAHNLLREMNVPVKYE